ncbi:MULTISPECIES: CCA tRNA nucleotidyltransferase [Pseudanabaena]|uniref:Polynucleotide adenylyltransferase region n=2 Tax=Pseudanabaena TaxID=1152 RepID=L8MYP9_9CYAN|nr:MULTISPECIES: CCA tRNA nucleotidyltransferase [Pseudanabaena]ELS31098.1 Polynucleotide adenylyltransferase region [Pseudanabaena biceps PCC 7429]MDG3496635.1 CCA tRNA nucleotidyltransferase [Pseudanabaena catenata USMAC16]
MVLKNFDRFFSPQQWQILLTTAQIAHDLNIRAFAVGGIVRDAIVRKHQVSPSFPKDIDLVFDGSARAGITVAIALHEVFPDSKLQIHEKFQTAELIWQDFTLDMATARREIYAYAGANPEVSATTLEEDLWRRDFTVNALALELDPQLGIKGEAIDRFQGLSDLVDRQVRVIREGSFAEDPRRIFRAVRFAIRLGFQLEQATHAEIMATTASGIHDAIGGARLRSELLYTLAEPKAAQMFALLQQLGALRCLHPALTLPADLTNSFKHQWRRSQYWLRLISGIENKNYAPLQLGLELLLSYLPPALATQLDLNLTPEQKSRQIGLADLLDNLPNLANAELKNSEMAQNLQRFDTQLLILAGAKCDPIFRPMLWRYLTQWQLVKSPLTGADLQLLGYATGKRMGETLKLLRSAALDLEIQSKEEAIAFLAARG